MLAETIYDWQPYDSSVISSTGALQTPTSATILRHTTNVMIVGAPTADDGTVDPGESAVSYWHETSPALRSHVDITTVSQGTEVSRRTDYDYDAADNLLFEKRYDSATGTWATTARTYSSNGNILTLKDAWQFTDSTRGWTNHVYGAISPFCTQFTSLYPTEVTAGHGSSGVAGASRTSRYEYECNSGGVSIE